MESTNSKVMISQPIRRMDDAKASSTISHLIDELNSLNIDIPNNSNIICEMLEAKGLHLNGKRTGRSALNIISLIRKL